MVIILKNKMLKTIANKVKGMLWYFKLNENVVKKTQNKM